MSSDTQELAKYLRTQYPDMITGAADMLANLYMSNPEKFIAKIRELRDVKISQLDVNDNAEDHTSGTE